MKSALEKVFTGKDSVEAHYVCDLLQERGIWAVVMGENLEAALGAIPPTYDTSPAVWVRPEEAEAAKAFVAEYTEKEMTPAGESQGKTWQCPNCGEMIDQQFDQCWNCQAQRPTGDEVDATDS